MTGSARQRLARPHPLAWVFVVAAIVDVAWFIGEAQFGANPSLLIIGSYILQVIPSLAGVLLAAALLARHPDAPTRARAIFIGTILFAIAPELQILSDPLNDTFVYLTPPSDELPGFVASSVVYNALISVVLAVALITIAVGLVRARHYEDSPGPVSMLFVPVMTVFGTIANVLVILGTDLSGVPLSAVLVVFLASTVIFPVLRVVAWSYLVTTLARGWRDTERPALGWRLGTVGSGLAIVALVLVNVGALIDPDTSNTPLAYTTLIAYALGHLGLLAAFAAGVPALDWGADEDDEEDEEGDAAEIAPVPTVVRRRQLEGQRRRR
jgi:hypothetical protein